MLSIFEEIIMVNYNYLLIIILMVNKENVFVKFVFFEGISEVVWLFWEIFSFEFKWIMYFNGIKIFFSLIFCVKVIFLLIEKIVLILSIY